MMDLPLELWLHIFSYLTPHDRLRSTRVCKQWNVLLRDAQLWRDDVVVIPCVNDGNAFRQHMLGVLRLAPADLIKQITIHCPLQLHGLQMNAHSEQAFNDLERLFEAQTQSLAHVTFIGWPEYALERVVWLCARLVGHRLHSLRIQNTSIAEVFEDEYLVFMILSCACPNLTALELPVFTFDRFPVQRICRTLPRLQSLTIHWTPFESTEPPLHWFLTLLSELRDFRVYGLPDPLACLAGWADDEVRSPSVETLALELTPTANYTSHQSDFQVLRHAHSVFPNLKRLILYGDAYCFFPSVWSPQPDDEYGQMDDEFRELSTRLRKQAHSFGFDFVILDR